GRERLRALVRETGDPEQMAFGARVLGEELDGLLAERERLSAYGLAHLALGLRQAGRPEAAAVASALAARVQNDHWDGGPARWGDPAVQATAVALEALAEIDPAHALIPRAAKWLLARREGTRWRSTRDTAAAISALLRTAGPELAAAPAGDGPAVRTVKVSHNGGAPFDVRVDFSNPLVSRAEVPLAAVAGANRVSIDAGELDVEVRMRIVDPAAAAGGQGISVSVEYDRPLSALRVGDEVVATLHVEAAADAVYAMALAPIPAGCELIAGSGEGPFQRFEARYEKALFFMDRLPQGRHGLRYRMRCAFAGEFAVGPAYAGLMYDERVRGWGAEGRVDIAR
ncbi:MAG TPA: hypothetical protein VEJ18_02335, partial [Planctomycetota bacterium]|nr:hypothetical protein [Planctomycetota bacterium]